MKSFTLAPIALLVLLVWPVGVHAAELPQEFVKCAEIDNDIARLQCFDDAVAKARGSKDSAAERAEREFGATGELKKELRPDEVEVESITARIDRIEMDGRVRKYYLDNGQVWEDVSRSRRILAEVGDEVEIEEGFFGSYTLSPKKNNRSIKVKRIR